MTDGSVLEVDNPSRWPDPTEVVTIEEPVITAKILTNEEYVGNILKLVEDKRGRQTEYRVRQRPPASCLPTSFR